MRLTFGEKLLLGFGGSTIFVIVFGVIGWIMNVIQIIIMAVRDEPLGTYFVLKLIAVPVYPLGPVLGWLHLFIR